MEDKEKKAIDMIEGTIRMFTSDGRFASNPYSVGLVNGLILALAMIEDKKPDLITPKEEWMK